MACLQPIEVLVKKRGETIVAPCGKCPECRRRRAESWVFRLSQEDKVHQKALFITLTYDKPPMTEKGFMTLIKKDYQDFVKRLRFNTGRKTIKYYACGEYGSNTWRPHYHAIIFDCTHEEVDKAWGHGHIHVGQVSSASVSYVTKYMCKPQRVPAHQNDDREKEFSLMSKKMGSNYLTPEMVQYHEQTQSSFVTLPGGYLQALPRYYRDRIFTEYEREALNSKAAAKNDEIYQKAVVKAGGEQAYYRNKSEAVRAAMKHYNENHKQLRKKV